MRNTYLFPRLASLTMAATLSLGSVLGGPSFEQRPIENVGWSVSFLSRSYDLLTDTTTFCYSLTADADEKDLSHWVVACDSEQVPFDAGPLTSYGLDPTTGLYGLKWDAGQDAGTTQTYCFKVNGNVDQALVEYSVKGGTYFAIGETVGCGEVAPPPPTTLTLCGHLFVDANGNGVRDADEPALANASVELFDADHNPIATVLTRADGSYEFTGLAAGTYVVGVPAATASEDLNEILAAYFQAEIPGEIGVALDGESVCDVDFGFLVDARDIQDDLDGDDPDGDGFTFAGDGKTIGFWKHQCTVAVRGKGRAQIDAVTLAGYLDAVEALFLAEPFQFADANEYAAALTVLESTSSDAADLLRKQLLGTELNHVSGRGLQGQFQALQEILLAWSEYQAAHAAEFTRDQLLATKDILDAINNTGE